MNRKQLPVRWSGERGVTLVELVVVIAVAGILVAVSSPTVFGAIRRERQMQVVSDVANHFRKARNQAMARGEAVLVAAAFDPSGASGGELRTFRLTAPLPGVGFVTGAPTCNMDEEDITTDDCPVGATCVQGPAGGGVCWGPAVRNCRDLATGLPMLVERYDVNLRSSSNMGIRRAFGTTDVVCFNPDGSATSNNGAPHGADNPGVSCAGEGYLVWMARRDAAIGFADVITATACGNTADQYEAVGGYVIRVNNNGEIGLRSPQ